MVQHVFAEVALAAIGAPGGVVAGNVAVLAAGDIFRRAGCNIVGAAERIIVFAQRILYDAVTPLEATGEQRGDQQQWNEKSRRCPPHGPVPSLFNSMAGLTRQSIEIKATEASGTIVIPGLVLRTIPE